MNDFSKELIGAMRQYADGIDKAIEKGLDTVAKEALRSVKNESPKRTGAYRRGWTIDKSRTAGNVSFVIYNKRHYRLTHLLENGHKTRYKSGKYGSKAMSRKIAHIAPAAERAALEAIKSVEKAVKG